MAQARIGKVIEVDPQTMPVGKLPPQLDPRAEFNRVSQILPPPVRIVPPSEARGEQKMVEKQKIEVDSRINIESAVRIRHQSYKRAEFQITVRRLEAFQMELIFRGDLPRPPFLAVKIVSSPSERKKIGGRISPKNRSQKKENGNSSHLISLFSDLQDGAQEGILITKIESLGRVHASNFSQLRRPL